MDEKKKKRENNIFIKAIKKEVPESVAYLSKNMAYSVKACPLNLAWLYFLKNSFIFQLIHSDWYNSD